MCLCLTHMRHQQKLQVTEVWIQLRPLEHAYDLTSHLLLSTRFQWEGITGGSRYPYHILRRPYWCPTMNQANRIN